MEEGILRDIRQDFLNGKPVVIVDEEREVEADFVYPAELITTNVVDFFLRYGKGLFCVVGSEDNLMNRGFFKLATNYNANYFVPIDWGDGTGISSSERALACNKLSDEKTTVNNFRYPGHVTLIGAKEFYERKGHSESSVELMKMTGFKPFSTIIEILDTKGNSHNLRYVERLAARFNLKVITIKQLWTFYVRNSELMKIKATAKLPTEFGEFEIVAFENKMDSKEHVAIIKKWEEGTTPFVRIHSECFTGDTLHSLRCDCGSQLSNALRKISKTGGVLIYLRQEGRGIGLSHKIEAYNLQDYGIDTYEANVRLGFKPDERDYAVAYQMLKALGLTKIVLLTNNTEKVKQLKEYGIIVERAERIFGKITEYNKVYLETKLTKFHHSLEELFESTNFQK